MQLDSDILESVRDETADYLRSLQQERDNVSDQAMPTNTIDLNRSCGDASTNIKVRVQKMRNNMKTGLDDAGSALMARVKSGSRSPKYGSNNGSFIDKPVWDKHHANCTN